MNPLTERRLLVAVPLLGLLAGAALWLAGRAPGAAFAIGALPVLVVMVAEMTRSLRAGDWGLDLIAALAIGFGLAMGESLAACLVALMYSGGQFLESHAARRAGAEMTALLARQPRTALRRTGAGLEEVPLAALAPGDLLLIPKGAVLPVDGALEGEAAVLDTAALTGEPMPRRFARGESLLSGTTNAGEAFDLRATTDAEASTYAGILRLVRNAQESRAPMARLAARWSVGFLLVTLALAGGAWAATGEPQRALAVLVVATPCPLILAVPVALLAGLSRAARLGLLVKSAAALEAMARVRAVMLDKTGTLTEGHAVLRGLAGPEEALRLGAALDQASAHPIARALVAAARAQGLALPAPTGVHETPGEGIEGTVEGRHVLIGGPGFVRARAAGEAPDVAKREPLPGETRVLVALDGTIAATLTFTDPLRPEAPALVAALRREGMRHVVIASGDAEAPVAEVARAVGADAFHARLDPAGKVAALHAVRAEHGPVLMLGDGVNDAPALKRADVGVAMGRKGTEAAKEAAEVVLADDNFATIAAAVRAGRTVYDNLTKTVTFLLPINGGEAMSIVLAILLGTQLPITPTQILWINMVSSVALALTLAFEPTEPGTMRQPPRPASQPLLTGFVVWRIVFVSLLFFACVFGMFTYGVAAGFSVETARTMAVNTLVVAEVAYLFSVRQRHGASLTWRAALGTPAVLMGVAAVVVLQLLFTYAPPLQALFQTEPLDPVTHWLPIFAVGVLVLLLLEVEKAVIRRGRRARRRAAA